MGGLDRIVVHILLPLNLVISLLLVGGGVIQNLKSAETVSLVEPIAVSAEGEILEDAVIDLDTETVTVDGEIVSNAQIVTEQFVPMGPAASQVAIKQTAPTAAVIWASTPHILWKIPMPLPI